QAAAEEAQGRGIGLIYALPDRGWLPFFRWGPRLGLPHFATAEYACVAREVGPATEAPTGLTCRPVDDLRPWLSDLWESAQGALGTTCAVDRSPAWMRYKYGGPLSLRVDPAGGGAPEGFVAVKRESGLIDDLIARSPETVGPVLAAAVAWAAGHGGPS